MLKNKVAEILCKLMTPLFYKVSPKHKKAIRLYESKPPYVVSQCGQSFKKYISENQMNEIINKLKLNMDKKSCDQIDIIYSRMLNFPEYSISDAFRCDYEKILTQDEKNDRALFLEMETQLNNKYKFNYPFSECVFFYHHGLKLLSDEQKEYIRGKVFLDIGSWIGDTALMLQEYEPSKVISFDINHKVIHEYTSLMEANGINPERYQNEILALGEIEGEVQVNFLGNDLSTGHSIKEAQGNEGNEGNQLIKQVKLDDYVKEHSLEVGLIQADIEGSEMDMILGAKDTIINQKPVLLIDIYHRPDQFFELKPLLESWGIEYEFMIRNFKFTNLAIAEVTLIAIPKILS